MAGRDDVLAVYGMPILVAKRFVLILHEILR
jgi:hypothetical protein